MSGIYVANHRFHPWCAIIAPRLDQVVLRLSEDVELALGRLSSDDLLVRYYDHDDWTVVVPTTSDCSMPRVTGTQMPHLVSNQELRAASQRVASLGFSTKRWF